MLTGGGDLLITLCRLLETLLTHTRSTMYYNYRSLLSFFVAAGVLVGITACDSFTEGYDDDPANATTAETNLILNSAQVASILFHDGNHARISGMWTQQFTGSDRQYSGIENYNANAGDFDNLWITGYADVIGDLEEVKEDVRDTNPLVLGIAQVIQAHTYGTKAALHGSVPYEEAGAGEENLNPEVTDQMAVYDGVLSTLDDAISNLEEGGVSPGSQDIFFGGDAAAWIETAYTLRARFLLHMNRPGDALAAAQNGISSPANNMIGPHGNTRSVDTNPFWLFVVEERPSYLTANNSYAADLLDEESGSLDRSNAKTDESARFSYYFTGEAGGWELNTSSGAYFGQETDYPILTYVENELIKAEAELLANGDLDAALTALNNAREATDDKFPDADYYENYELDDFEDGGIANPQGESQGNALLREILEEKYLSLMGHLEAFNDVRRTDNFLGIPPTEGDQLPQRFFIAQAEVTANENIERPIPGLFEVTPANDAISYDGL